MTNATWKKHPGSNNFRIGTNWSTNTVPDGTATFGKSSIHSIELGDTVTNSGGWTFTAAAPNYFFHVGDNLFLHFLGAGIITKGSAHVTIISDRWITFENSSSAGKAHIVINDEADFNGFSTAGSATITATTFSDIDFNNSSTLGRAHLINNSSSDLTFYNTSTAGHATITNNQHIVFANDSSADHSVIINNSNISFAINSSAGNAVITTAAGGTVEFFRDSDGDNARFITKAGGTVNFSNVGGGLVHAGSIEGAGTYLLGGNELIVGGNNRSATVSGLIDGIGGSIAKVGLGTLKLSHANNTFTGGIVLTTGVLDIAAIGAAGSGPGNIVFTTGSTDFRGTLKIENAAFSGHHFNTEIQLFSGNDKLLLPGLKFKPHAKAAYDSDDGILTVKSGHVTDTFDQFFNPAGTQFKALSDGHGGTKVVVVAAHAKADHADSFAFKASAVQASTPNHAPAEDHQEHVAAYLSGTSEAPFAADILPHQLTEFAHHGELFR